jgi:type IV secretion system protein VirD4
MQLSANEAIVMISGVQPIRATKARYYEDPQLKSRVLPAPRGTSDPRPPQVNDWTARSPIPPSPVLLATARTKRDDENGGIRREPEPPQHEEIVVRAPSRKSEFDAGPDEPDAEAIQASALTRSMQGTARAVSLDPDDGMGL